MPRSPAQLRRHALQIWHAGLEAVRSERLVRNALRVEGRTLVIGEERLPLDAVRRIAVVGAGKAGAGMAAAVEEALGPRLMDEKQIGGWVNVPADCVHGSAGGTPVLRKIHLHAARPAGVNEPTAAGVAGAEEILRIVESLGPDDLCLCLISGGGSALMPAPAEGICLEDKLAITQHLSAAGANIEELNTVRKQLSRIKGGGLARACRAGRLVALIISDVLGDPLDVIASGPTVPDSSTPDAALAVLEKYAARQAGIAPAVFECLERGRPARREDEQRRAGRPRSCQVTNLVIGNNATAVDAAGKEAERLGFSHAMICAQRSEGPAEEVGRHLAEMALRMRGANVGQALPDADPRGVRQSLTYGTPDCLISGGEPVVKLVEKSRRGLGGRNQQLVLAALERLTEGPAWQVHPDRSPAENIVLLSGGTDGEDGPTDAAGAWLDAEVCHAARQSGMNASDFLTRNDAYHFFAPLDALIKTGPTHTNVCDVRVVVVDR